MPNHYHFLLYQDSEQGISQFIQVLFNAYVQALNKQLHRKGPLFESRFKHVLIDQENYLTHLCRYIHLNPRFAGLVENPEEWPYSNYREWIGLREGQLVNHDFIREHFSAPKEYKSFVEEYIIETPLEERLKRYYLD
jgi:hypothetical protein